MSHRIDIDGAELMRLRLIGATLDTLASRFSCSVKTIENRLRKLDMGSQRTRERTSGWKGGERLNSQGYAIILQPNHSKADHAGYVRRSIVMWEAYHNLPWPEGRVPHHLDGDRSNDDPKNILSLLPAEHSLLEAWIRREKQADSA